MTGRHLINSALRIVNAIRQNEMPEYSMFESARETLNLLLGSWSAEELMPHHYEPHKIPLFAATPNYTIEPGATYDSDGICMAQTPGGAGALTLNGVYVSSSVATLDIPRHILIDSTADDSALTLTVTGTSEYGDALTEVITGPDTTTVRGYKRFKTVTGVTTSGAAAGAISVGTDYVINIRRPVKIPYAYLRDSDGLDTPLKVIDKNRYDEIEDKDEAGVPTKLYYDRSNPAGEVYIHPVPATGVALANNSGTECISNGGFDSGTGWTLGTLWSISGGKMLHTGAALIEQLSDPYMEDAGNWDYRPTAAGYWSFDNPGFTYTDNGYTAGVNELYTDEFDTPLVAGEQYTVTITLSGTATNISTPAGNVYIISNSTLSGKDTLATCRSGVADISMTGEEFSITIPSNWGGTTQSIGLGFYGFEFAFSVTQFSVSAANAATNTASQVSGALANALSNGTLYRMTFDISDYSAGSVTPSLGNLAGPTASWDGAYSALITAGAGGDVDFDCTGPFAGKIDNVSVIDLPYNTLTPVDYELIMDLWLPFVEVTATNLDDEINLPGEYLLALRWNLAAELAPEYGKEPSLYILIRAKQTLDAIKMLNGLIPKQMNMSKPLPIIGEQIAVSQL